MRTQKTKRNIINAFLTLRAKKPTEKITIKELSELAEINKATFYLHYHDIYDLSEELERETVESCLKGIEHPEFILGDTQKFVRELESSFVANEQLIKLLFNGSRNNSFITLLEEGLIDIIGRAYPDYEISTESRMKITYLVYGGYYTYFKYCDYGIMPVMKLIEKFSEGIGKIYDVSEIIENSEEE